MFFALESAFGLLFLRIVLKNCFHPYEWIRKKLEQLKSGDYSGELALDYPGNEWGEIMESLNCLSRTLYQDMSNLDNYYYLKKQQKRENVEKELVYKRISSNIAHQLETPLAIISSQVEMDSMEEDPEKREYYCQSIQEEIDK